MRKKPNMNDIIEAGITHYAEQERKQDAEEKQYWERVREEQHREDTKPGWHTRYVGTDHDAVDYYIPCDHRGNCGCEDGDG